MHTLPAVLADVSPLKQERGATHTCAWLTALLLHAGSMGRTAEDLVMLDSIVRTPNITTTGVGILPTPVSCNVNVNRNLSLAGLRIGLPSTLGGSGC